jgi:predicted amidohydrolase YtcJ
MNTRSLCLLLAAALVLGIACAPASDEEPADLVIHNGKVITVDESLPEAEAVAARDGHIVFVGSSADAQAFIGPDTEVIDLDGKLLIPGFEEGHAHFMSIGNAMLNVNLMGTTSYQEVIDLVAAAAAEAQPGEWIVGRGWHQSKWDPQPEHMVRGFQTHHALSAATPDNPVWLSHASGHASFANALAMELGGIDRDTPQPEGGEIIKDENGDPTGIFVERAGRGISRALAEAESSMTDEERAARRWRQLELADQEVISKGITTFHDAGEGESTIEFFKEAIDQGRLDVRLYVMLSGGIDESDPSWQEDYVETLDRVRTIGYGDDMLTVRSIKMLMDGALGPRGAWMLEPYEDDPHNTGHNTGSIEAMNTVANLALENGYQLCIHAIGDRGNQEVLNIYEQAYEAHPEEAADARFRIEHSQLLDETDIPRFAELGVIASMQGIHCTSDGPWVPDRIGDARSEEGAYVWQKLMQTGAVVTNGTDAPVEDVDPIASYYATVSRLMPNGERFYPDQAMSRMEALKSYTLNVAYSGFEENIKGSITPGKLADFVVLSQDILTIPEDRIPDTEVLYTIVGGKVVYEAH